MARWDFLRRTRLAIMGAAAVLAVAGAGSGQADSSRTANVRATAVSLGVAHSCALTTTGGVQCWGSDAHDELGDGTGDSVDSLLPVRVVGLQRGVIAIAVGTRHSCALTTAGGVKCWGAAYSGALGDGTDDRRAAPVDVVDLGSEVTAIAAGYDHSCALTAAGGVKCWGYNFAGSLGDGTTDDRLRPVDVVGLSSGVTQIATGIRTCALTSAGAVKCWGGWSSDRWRPVTVAGLGSGVRALGTGGASGPSCAITTSGAVKCWALDYDEPAVDVPGLSSGVRAVATGLHNCALTAAGGVKCWGPNDHGQLGDGTKVNRAIPVDVIGLHTGVVAIGVGVVHSCAVLSSGGVKCWGGGGPLGDGTTADRTRPVSVVGFGAKSTLSIVARSVTVTPARLAAIKLRCGTQAVCQGTLKLTGAGMTLGSRGFTIAPGKAQAVEILVSVRGFQLLARLKRLPARARVTYKQPAGGSTMASHAVTLRAPGG